MRKFDVKAKKSMSNGFGLIMELDGDLPRKYDAKTMGAATEKGYVLTGSVLQNLGGGENSPQVGAHVSVTVRADNERKVIFDDLAKTLAANTFMLEGVEAAADGSLKARWANGAEDNREIMHYEIVGRPTISFDNPKDDGIKGKPLNMDLAGGDYTYNQRNADNTYTNGVVIPNAELTARLKATVESGGKFNIYQRAFAPSKAVVVDSQEELDATLEKFREEGYTSCFARTFVEGTTNPEEIDIQMLFYPNDIPAKDGKPAKVYDKPQLEGNKKFEHLQELADAGKVVKTEIVPGLTAYIVGNKDDHTKSAKHKLAASVVAGFSDSQKGFYGSQHYGPGIITFAKSEDGVRLGALKPAARTEGKSFKGLMNLNTTAFPNASDVVFTKKAQEAVENNTVDAAENAEPTVPAM